MELLNATTIIELTMPNNKLVKSTRNIEEHIDNLLAVQESKSKGKPDSVICKELQISHTTLQKYKDLIVKQHIELLTPEYQDAKRCELDDQIQAILRKLFSTINTVEENYDALRREVEAVLNNPDLDPESRIRMIKFSRYPVEDLVELKKVMISAVDLRSKIWGLDRDGQQKVQINNNRKLVFQVTPSVEGNSNKLDKLADSIISNVCKVN